MPGLESRVGRRKCTECALLCCGRFYLLCGVHGPPRLFVLPSMHVMTLQVTNTHSVVQDARKCPRCHDLHLPTPPVCKARAACEPGAHLVVQVHVAAGVADHERRAGHAGHPLRRDRASAVHRAIRVEVQRRRGQPRARQRLQLRAQRAHHDCAARTPACSGVAWGASRVLERATARPPATAAARAASPPRLPHICARSGKASRAAKRLR